MHEHLVEDSDQPVAKQLIVLTVVCHRYLRFLVMINKDVVNKRMHSSVSAFISRSPIEPCMSTVHPFFMILIGI